jgi:peptidoglycan lytic transglycosylase
MPRRVRALALALPIVVSAAGLARADTAECGRASYFTMTSRTASGVRANPNGMFAAHRTLPFGTMIRVENLRNGRSVLVQVNDRGPFVRGRVVDVSRAAADRLGFVSAGTAPVRVTVAGHQTTAKGC